MSRALRVYLRIVVTAGRDETHPAFAKASAGSNSPRAFSRPPRRCSGWDKGQCNTTQVLNIKGQKHLTDLCCDSESMIGQTAYGLNFIGGNAQGFQESLVIVGEKMLEFDVPLNHVRIGHAVGSQ